MGLGNSKRLLNQVERIFQDAKLLGVHTRKRYREACGRFCRWAAERFGLDDLGELHPEHVRAYAEWLQGQGWQPKTIKTELSGLVHAHTWLKLAGRARYTGELPSPTELGLGKAELGPDRRWLEADLERMVAAALEAGEERWADMMRLAWELGLRIHEVARLGRVQAEPRALARGVLVVIGKGGKVREVPLTAEAVKILEKWRGRVPRGKKLFVRDGETTGQVIKGLQEFIRQHRGQAEEGYGPLTFHGLRYSYAQREEGKLREKGVEKRERFLVVSRKLGHGRPSVSKTYVRQ